MTIPSDNLLNELRATLGLLEIALGTIQDGILWTDETGVIQWCNAGFDNLTGRTHIEILGARFDDVLPLEQSGSDPIETILKTPKEPLYYSLKKDDKTIILEITGSVFHVPHHPKSTVLVIRDITAAKAAESLVKKKSEELARSNKELEEFAFVASHDLQEPLRMVQGFTERLSQHLGDHIDEQAAKYMHYVTDGAIRMRTLIQDLLAYSRAGRNELRMVEMDFNELVDEVVDTLSAAIKASGVRLILHPLPRLTASPVMMRQVFQNLIANAAKFHGPKDPFIDVSAAWNGTEWVFTIEDNGIGIDPKYHGKIFEIFQRLHSMSQYPGTGIGLAICRKIVERHGGRIRVESEEGKGAKFHFTLPAPTA